MILSKAFSFFPNNFFMAWSSIPVISDNFLELLNLKMSSAADFPTKKPGKLNSGISDLPILKPSSGRFIIFSLVISILYCSL